MTTFPDPAELTQRTIEILGGREAAFAIIDEEFAELNKRWNQDVEAIGRLLRSHLYVEHFVTEHLLKSNPGLGSIKEARLSFTQKVDLLDRADVAIQDVLPGIRHLNKVRNRLAHSLHALVTQDDANVFLSVPAFKALRSAGAAPDLPSQDPMDVLEGFAKYATSKLTSKFSRYGAAVGQAISDFQNRALLKGKLPD